MSEKKENDKKNKLALMITMIFALCLFSALSLLNYYMNDVFNVMYFFSSTVASCVIPFIFYIMWVLTLDDVKK